MKKRQFSEPKTPTGVKDSKDSENSSQADGELLLIPRSVLELMPGRVYLVADDYRVRFANSEAIADLGRDPRGEPCHLAVHNRPEPCEGCKLEQVLSGELLHYEIHDPVRDRWDRCTHIPLRQLDDTRLKLTVALDISQEKRNEVNLRTSRERYQLLLENLEEMVFALDVEGRFTFVSKAFERLSEYKVEEFIGLPFERFVVAEDLPRLRREFQRCLLGEPLHAEFRTIKRDGSLRYVRVSSRPRLEDGKVVELTGVMSDLTDLRKAEEEKRTLEEQLHQSQKMEALGRLAGGVAHDFNNLLFVIMNQANYLARGLDEQGADADRARQIEQAAERAADLTRQLLQFSRRKPVKPKVVDLNESLVDLKDMLARILGEDIGLEVNLADDLDAILSDPAHISQVLMNLVANARDAMPRGGRLTIDTAQVEFSPEWVRRKLNVDPGDYVLLAVSDTGCGMSEEAQKRAFEPFFTTKPGGLGSGLGLATVYSIVNQLGGFIEIDSAEGRGTVFRIYFRTTAEHPIKAASPSQPSAPDLSGKTILLVEDEGAVRDLVLKMLQECDVQIIQADTAENGLALLREHVGPIHLLLTDVILPGMSGSDLADLVRTERPDTAVLYMSGYTGNAIVQHGLRDDHIHLLHKPFRSHQLLAKIQEVLCPA